METTPRNLEALRSITDPAEQARAAKAYIDERAKAIDEATEYRDAAIAALLLDGHTTGQVAVLTGMSAGHVKAVRRWKARE